jgi:dipeptidyl aminopeptidase/acylaminoacyl peptidase
MTCALPYDTAFSLRTFPWGDEPALSPDGKWLAYGVLTPPLWSASRGLPTEPRYLPDGTPHWAVGIQLHLTEIATGDTRLIGPARHNSWRPSWSPDSTRIAFFSDAGGVPQLWLYDLGQSEAQRGSELPLKPNLFPGDEALWSPEGTELYVRLRPDPLLNPRSTFAEPDAGTGEAPTVDVAFAGSLEEPLSGAASGPGSTTPYIPEEHNATLAVVDLRSGSVRTLVPAETVPRPGCLRLSPSGQWVSYLSVPRPKELASSERTYDLVLIPATGGTVDTVAADLPVPEDCWLGTYQWHSDRDVLLYFKDRRLWLVDLTEGDTPSPRPLAPELGDLAPTPMAFTRGGRHAVVRPIGDPDSASREESILALVPLDGSPSRTLTLKGVRHVSAVLKVDPQTLWQPEPGSLTISFRDATTRERVIARVDLESGETQRLREGEFHLRWFAGGRDQRSAVGVFETVSTPAHIFAIDRDFSQGRRLTQIEPRLDDICVGPVVTFETLVPQYDGTLRPVKSCVLLPPGAKPGDRLPTVVEVYPGVSTWHLATLFGGGSPASIPALLFTTRGYAVLLPELSIGPEGVSGNPIQETTDILLPQVNRAVELGYSDVERVALIGQSHGGYGVAGVLAQTNLFRAGVAISGCYDLPGQYAEQDPRGNTLWIAWSESGQFRMGTHPWQDLQRYLANSPYYQAEKIQTPLLLIHGEKDWLAKDTPKMFHALKRLGKTAELATYAGEGHVVSNWSQINASDAARRILEFLEQYMGGS